MIPSAPVTVCVFAHNEAETITATLTALILPDDALSVHVYANGCTDDTVARVRAFASDHPRVHLHELAQASKPLAWNRALADHADLPALVLADGDVLPAPGAPRALTDALDADPTLVIAAATLIPPDAPLDLERRLVRFLHRPLRQDFLAGGLYALRPAAIRDLLTAAGLPEGLPEGLLGDDALLERLVGPQHLRVLAAPFIHTPPDLAGYIRYLARLRWQNEQLALALHAPPRPRRTLGQWLTQQRGRTPAEWLHYLPSRLVRLAFEAAARPAIARAYRAFGPVRVDATTSLHAPALES